ncbi:unnamed protein product [Hydatigera taeniaeformis]|uniref:RNase_PH domain-containing protein n=1 Tax=Hydatigena taeniaeformis TaxID=6205 RepID=A0A0R3WZB8_HYDTA|nr:unnamed protein product [Hydatigera taeniaeformis]
MDRFKASPNAIDLCYFIKQHKKFEPPSGVPPMYFALGINHCADGSAYLEYGRIKVACCVCGPIELKQDGQLVTSFRFAPFSSQVRCDSLRDAEEKRLSQLLLAALEPSIILDSFPRGKYQIAVTILDDGTELTDYICNTSSCLSAGITCGTLALVHAGVQMYDLAIGLDVVSAALNSSTSESNASVSSIAVMPQLRQVTMFNGTSLELLSVGDLRKVMEEAFTRAESVYNTIQDALYSMMKNEYEALEKPE